MSSKKGMSRGNKVIASIAACFFALLIALLAEGTVNDKVLWFIEISGFCWFAIWTIW